MEAKKEDYLQQPGLPEGCSKHLSVKTEGMELAAILWAEIMGALVKSMQEKKKFRAVLEYDSEEMRSDFQIIDESERRR